MTLDYFQAFWDLGYDIIVERPDVPYLIQGMPAEACLVRRDRQVERGPSIRENFVGACVRLWLDSSNTRLQVNA
jgi:hypothetical protein